MGDLIDGDYISYDSDTGASIQDYEWQRTPKHKKKYKFKLFKKRKEHDIKL